MKEFHQLREEFYFKKLIWFGYLLVTVPRNYILIPTLEQLQH